MNYAIEATPLSQRKVPKYQAAKPLVSAAATEVLADLRQQQKLKRNAAMIDNFIDTDLLAITDPIAEGLDDAVL